MKKFEEAMSEFGVSKTDKLFDGLDNFLRNLYDVKEALTFHHFPYLLTRLLYLPFMFIILFFDLLRAQITWWLANLVIGSMLMLFTGVIMSLLVCCSRSAKTYQESMRNRAKKQEEEAQNRRNTQPNRRQ